MADPSFLSGFIGVGIDMAIRQIIHHVGIAVRCKEELESMRNLVTIIEPMVCQIHRCHLELNRKKTTSTAGSDINASVINKWVRSLHHRLLQQALAIVQKSCYQTSRRITSLISEIEKHLKLVPFVALQQQQTQMLTEMPRESAQASTSTSTTGTSEGLAPTAGGFLIQEPLIVGQEKDFTALEMWVIDADVKPLFCMGCVVGKGGSGKTLKSLFSSQKSPYSPDSLSTGAVIIPISRSGFAERSRP